MPISKLFFTTAVLPMVCFASALVPLHAQYDNGSLVGTIKDASGAAIPDSQVIFTNTATGITATTKTSSTGECQFPDVRVGVYDVAATATGFSKAEADRVTVFVGVRQRIDLVECPA